MNSNQTSENQLLEICDVSIAYEERQVIFNTSFSLNHGEIGCLLGPSGCGKSTMLRAIAGFEGLINGTIRMDGKTLSEQGFTTAPEKRRVGMVFQDSALFPHLTVEENIGFGLRKLNGTAKSDRVRELIHLFSLHQFETRYPHSLSGGEQQRVAVARAMAPKPKLLLLDEAFSSLDVALKQTLVPEVRGILNQEQMSAILVTHNEGEAFAFADRVGVMNKGEIHQWEDPYALYHRPVNRFVANFVGEGKLINAMTLDNKSLESLLGIHKVEDDHQIEPGQEVQILVRPDDILHDDESRFRGEILNISFRGSHYQYLVRLDSGQKLFCFADSHHKHRLGEWIGLLPKLEHLVIFDADKSSVVYDSTLDIAQSIGDAKAGPPVHNI